MSESQYLLDVASEDPEVVQEIVEAVELDEAWNLIRRRRPKVRSYRRSRVAKARWRRHKATYKRAMKKWLRSPRAKSFYRRLARWKMAHEESVSSEKDVKLLLGGLLEFFKIFQEELDILGDSDLQDIGGVAGFILDELFDFSAVMNESADWQEYYHWWEYYTDWKSDFEVLMAEEGLGTARPE
jgi:hypothetical protein